MASSTENPVKVDLTTCSICFETFKTPKYFPCLHSFCEGCIKTYITTTFVQTKGGVNCPVCRMYVLKPEDISIDDWSSKLPTNHILVSLIDTNELKSGQKLCAACSRENESESATSWCINCGEALCKSCERYHRRNKFLSNHKVVDIENYGTTELPYNHKDIQCTEHPDKNVEAYCSDHSAICCMTCVMLKHRKCDNVGSIQDAAEEMKKSKEVKSFKDDLMELKKTLDALVECTMDNLQNFDKDIKKMKLDSKSGQKLCIPCSRENETESASSWCINCGEALCKLCERYHRKQKSSITHKLIDIGNYETTDLKCNYVDIPCTEHPDKIVEAYCRDHSAICCMTCAFLKHRNCKNVGSIHDVAEEMKTSREVENFSDVLQDVQNTLDAMLQYTSGNLQEFDKDIEKMKVDVDTLFTKLSNHLSQLKSDILSEISKLEKEVRPAIEDKHDEIKCKISTIENDLALFQTNMKYAPPAQFLQAMEKLMEQRSILEQFVNEESQKLKEIRVTFDASEKLLEIEKDIKAFGEVNIRRTSRTDMLRSTDKQVDMSSVVPTLSSDIYTQYAVTGISVLENGLVLLSTYGSQTIELRDHQCSSVLSSSLLPGHPWGIKMTSDTEGAVAIERRGLIIFNIQNNQITKIKEIRTNVNRDFVYHQGKYYIGCDKNIAVYDSNHHKVRDISVDNNVGYMAVRDGTFLCYTVWGGRELYCITMDGTPVFTYTHDKLRYTSDVTVDHAGYIYVCGYRSKNVHQRSHDGKLQRIIFNNLSLGPNCVSFNKHGDKAVIGCDGKVLSYDIK
ncbi:hypothetical protein FSP39_013840 [Pinctada imbricata]|uniref:Uncharacterized protein n=1 Tax=Pinctada imbricata TaxID=66713 RepID=A0AA88XL65_PINIB|nr:hypothetical protein FSP39_013840 [Pinctada imbricata]